MKHGFRKLFFHQCYEQAYEHHILATVVGMNINEDTQEMSRSTHFTRHQNKVSWGTNNDKTNATHITPTHKHRISTEEPLKKPTDLDLHCLPLSTWIYINNQDQVIWLAENKKWVWHLNLFSMTSVNSDAAPNYKYIFGLHRGSLPNLWNIKVKLLYSEILWWNKANGSMAIWNHNK